MRALSFLVVTTLLASSSAVARVAHAQTSPSVTGILGAVQRCEPPMGSTCTSADSPGETPHPIGVLDDEIETADCNADLLYNFELGIANPSTSYVLEIWAGTQDCSQLANRRTSETSVCWPVAPFQAAEVSPFVISARVQDIVSGAFTTTHPVTYLPTTGAAVCQFPAEAAATTVTLYMFFVDAASNPVGTVQQYPMVIVPNDAGASGDDGGHDTGATGTETAPAGGACTASRRKPSGGGSLIALGVAAIGISVIRKRGSRAISRRAPL